MGAIARSFNRYDLLKLVALVAMTLDHLAALQFPELTYLRVIGRAAAPIFLFLVGYNGSYGFRWPLLIAAIVVTLADGLLIGMWYPQNILWSILLGRFALAYVARKNIALWALLLACAIWYVPLTVVIECSTIGFVWMLFGHTMKHAPQSREALLYGAVGFVGAALQTAILYTWSAPYQLAAVCVCAITWVALWNFTPTPMKHDSALLRQWSRFALAYYVLHKLLLEAL